MMLYYDGRPLGNFVGPCLAKNKADKVFPSFTLKCPVSIQYDQRVAHFLLNGSDL